MKNILIKSILPMLIFTQVSVNAMPISGIIPTDDNNDIIASSELQNFKTDQELKISPTEGSVSIKRDAIILSLSEASTECKESVCISTQIRKLIFEVPLKNVSKNECGIIQYVGYENLIPVDGANTEIIVTDNSHNHCPSIALLGAFPKTEVKLTTEFFNRQEGKYIKASSVFTGGVLKATIILL